MEDISRYLRDGARREPPTMTLSAAVPTDLYREIKAYSPSFMASKWVRELIKAHWPEMRAELERQGVTHVG